MKSFSEISIQKHFQSKHKKD